MPPSQKTLQDLSREIVTTLEKLTGIRTAVGTAAAGGGAVEVRVRLDDGSECFSLVMAAELDRMARAKGTAYRVALSAMAVECVKGLRMRSRQELFDEWLTCMWAGFQKDSC